MKRRTIGKWMGCKEVSIERNVLEWNFSILGQRVSYCTKEVLL